MSVLPSAIPTRKAIILPLMAVAVKSCVMLFARLVKVRTAAPVTLSDAANHQYPGTSATRV